MSPSSGLKRTASFPFGPVTEVTPKRARTAIIASPSPSIKTWLKRSASEPVSFQSDSDKEKSVDNACKEINVELLKGNKDLIDKTCEINSAESKRRKIEDPVVSTSEKLVKKSCKRKLTDIDPDTSPKKQKKQKSIHDGDKACNGLNSDVSNAENMGETKRKSPSPKKSEILKNLDSELNKSPNKNLKENENCELNFSPIRLPMKNFDTNIYASPTANLPNVVSDAPLVVTQPSVIDNQKKKTVDWLTQMRIQKMNKECFEKKPEVDKHCSIQCEDLSCHSVPTSVGSTTPRKPAKAKVTYCRIKVYKQNSTPGLTNRTVALY